jgi:hypothetical protein
VLFWTAILARQLGLACRYSARNPCAHLKQYMDDLYKQLKNRKTHDEQSRDRREGHRQRRAYIAGLTDDADLDEEARIIYERHTSYPPDHFLETTSKKSHRMREAFGDGDGWAVRLWDKLEEPYAYTLRTDHLGLPPECSDPAKYVPAKV